MKYEPSDNSERPFRAEELLAEVRNKGGDPMHQPPPSRERIRDALDRRPEPVLQLGLGGSGVPLPMAAAERLAAHEEPSPVQKFPTRPPIEVPNHSLLRCLGEGGFGQVWLAQHMLTEHYQACKIIRASKAVELEGIRQLKQRVPAHPHLFPIDDVGVVGDWLFCLMPLADNGTAVPKPDLDGYEPLSLQVYLARIIRLPAREVALIGSELSGALHHLHEHGVIHGDVKPANILRLDSRWTLADYSLVRNLAEPSVGGTSGYTPPEGPGQPRADQFALGVVLFEALTGWNPRMLADFKSTPISRFKLDGDAPKIRTIILRTTENKPEDRFGSMREVTAALRASLAPRRLRRLVFGVASIAVLAGTALTIAMLRATPTPAAVSLPKFYAAPMPAAVHVKSFEVRQTRYDGSNDVSLGRLGHESATARLDDDLTVYASLNSPGYVFLLALETTGRVKLCLPDSVNDPPNPAETISYPVDPGAAYRLTDGTGTHGFILLVSATPLSSWTDWTAKHGEPIWSAGALPADGVWVYDGAHLSLADPTRSEVRSRRGGPRPILNVIDWAKRQPGIQSAYLVAFPVIPQKE